MPSTSAKWKMENLLEGEQILRKMSLNQENYAFV